MARKCSVCKKTGHNSRNCPTKNSPATKASAKKKPSKTKGKYPDYCKLNEAAVRAQWVCDKWLKGTVGEIKEAKLGVDV